MSPNEALATIQSAGRNIFNQVRVQLGDAWDDFTESDRDLVMKCSIDAAELQVRALAIPPNNTAEQMRMLREKAQVHAQLLSLAAAESARVASIFWDVVKVVIGGAVAVVFAAL
jgi:hypothetical protein